MYFDTKIEFLLIIYNLNNQEMFSKKTNIRRWNNDLKIQKIYALVKM
jgi:hypothetical protein